MTLAYRWFPIGTNTLYYDAPEVGAVVAFEHAAMRVVAVDHVDESDWEDAERDKVQHLGPKYHPYRVILRPVAVVGDDPRARDHDLHYRVRGACWEVYPNGHYPVCAECQEPVPCRQEMARRVAADSSKQMARYETPGVCPACSEPITARQKSVTFEDNLEIPGGAPVTYHAGRAGCVGQAARYEQRWVDADPKRRRTTLTCPGRVINHNDGTYECSELTECRGPSVRHFSYSVCRCPDCHTRGSFDCHPAADAELLRRDVS